VPLYWGLSRTFGESRSLCKQPRSIALPRVSPITALRVHGNSFRVEPLQQNPEQLVLDAEPTVWCWEVTPTEWGKHTLSLSATIILGSVPYGRVRKDYALCEQDVDVGANYLYTLKELAKANWQWSLTSGVLLVVFGTLGGLLRRLKREKGRKRSYEDLF
jgi:hypothetical protein